MTRECPHCQFPIRPDLEKCPACGRGSEPWVLFDNTWWRTDDRGGWLRYEPFQPPQGWHPWPGEPPWATASSAIATARVS